MSKVTRTQTRAPRAALSERSLDRENKSYLYVQVSEPGVYKSPLGMYLDMESPTKPGERMYTVKARGDAKGDDAWEQRALAGGEDMILLECDKADAQALMEIPAKEALRRERRVAGKTKRAVDNGAVEEYEEMQGGILSAS